MTDTILFKNINSDPEQVIIDVRSPSEFAKGHIYGAINIPLFTDAERTIVGTAYKKVSKENAMLKGLEFIGPKMAPFVKRVRKLSNHLPIVVYCWRGGMRSESFTWLLNLSGIKAMRIKGGYKAYKNYIRNSFENVANITILGGVTGSGKTDLIQLIDKQGIQTIDLEGVANHKGSAFGHINEEPQPTNEQFENDLYQIWKNLDLTKPIIVENESAFVGRVSVPAALFEQMKNAPVISINITDKKRIDRLVRDYVNSDQDLLIECCNKIGKRLGSEKLKKIVDHIKSNDHASAASLLLSYYDHYYLMGLEKRELTKLIKLDLFEEKIEDNAELLIVAINELEEKTKQEQCVL